VLEDALNLLALARHLVHRLVRRGGYSGDARSHVDDCEYWLVRAKPFEQSAYLLREDLPWRKNIPTLTQRSPALSVTFKSFSFILGPLL
jgi:hypothetical protein